MFLNKKAQVSLFVIAGLVLIIVLALALIDVKNMNSFFSNGQRERAVSYDYERGSFETHLQSCVKNSVEQSIFQVASHGGYLFAYSDGTYGESGSADSVNVGGEDIPVLLDSSDSHFLSDDEVAKRICRSAMVKLDSCFDISSYAAKGFSIDKTSYSLPSEYDENCKAILKPASVVVFMNYSVLLSKEDFRFNLSYVSTEVNLPLKNLMDDARNLIDEILGRLDNTIDLSDGCSLSSGVRALISSSEIIRLEEQVSFSTVNFFFQFGFKDFEITGSC